MKSFKLLQISNMKSQAKQERLSPEVLMLAIDTVERYHLLDLYLTVQVSFIRKSMQSAYSVTNLHFKMSFHLKV